MQKQVQQRAIQAISTVTLRDYLRTKTALLAIVPLALLWAGGVLLVLIDLDVWRNTDPYDRLFAMVIVLGAITFVSMLPYFVWSTFDVRERERIQNQAVRELKNHGWKDLEKAIAFHYKGVHDETRYRIPVFAATSTAVFGWSLFMFSTGPGIVIELLNGTPSSFIGRLAEAHPVGYGFVGAYLFVVGTMIRRYHRGDLLPNVFINVVYHVWTALSVVFVVGIIWVLFFNEAESSSGIFVVRDGHHQLGPNELMGLVLVSFAAGIAPWPTLRELRRMAGSAWRGLPYTGQSEDLPNPALRLTSVAGLDEYHAQRLLEEGIEDVTNLAMADIPRLMVSLRSGGVRILDEIDQALFITHVGQDLDDLRKLGFRTASGLVRAYLGPGVEPDDTAGFWLKYSPHSPYLKTIDKGLEARLYHYVQAMWYNPNYRWLKKFRGESRAEA